MSVRHVALIVEDDPATLAILVELVKSIGHEARTASTLAEVRAAAQAGGYCYVLLDMQIPSEAGAMPMIGSGETALALLREREPDRNANGRHLLQILIVTAYSREPDFVARMYDADANGFIDKPFGAKMEQVLDKIRACLKRAGREEHGDCARKTRVKAPEAITEKVELAIDGTRVGRRTAVHAGAARRELPDARFILLLRLIDAHLRTPGAWSTRQELGIGRSPEIPSRIREAFEGVFPEGFELMESDRAGKLRLNPEVGIGRIDWKALAGHPNAGVQRVARGWMR